MTKIEKLSFLISYIELENFFTFLFLFIYLTFTFVRLNLEFFFFFFFWGGNSIIIKLVMVF